MGTEDEDWQEVGRKALAEAEAAEQRGGEGLFEGGRHGLAILLWGLGGLTVFIGAVVAMDVRDGRIFLVGLGVGFVAACAGVLFDLLNRLGRAIERLTDEVRKKRVDG